MRFLLAAAVFAACQPPGYHQGQGTAADAAGSAADAARAVDAAADAGSGSCSYDFQLFGYGGVQSVWLTGDFVQWAAAPSSGAIPMMLGSGAAWQVTHAFAPGTYQYKFIVDGSDWIPDPDDANVVDDGFGGHNSVYVCN